MKKPNLFFDFDEFLFSTKDAAIAYIQHRHGVTINLDRYYSSHELVQDVNEKLEDSKKVDHATFIDDYGQNFLPSHTWHEDVQPMPGMTEVVPRLAEHYSLHIVTSRQKQTLLVIEKLLEMHVPGCISHIHCVWTKEPSGVFSSVSKREFIESTQGENIAFFDDSPVEIQAVADIIPAYLFDPHFLHNEETGVQKRIHSWEEIGELLLKNL